MILTNPNLAFLFTTIDTSYWDAFNVTATVNPMIATEIQCSTETWLAGWIGSLDKMRLWEGSRLTRSVGPQTYSVTPKHFELTLGIERDKVLDDSYGIYYPMAQGMAIQAKKAPDYELRDLINGTGNWTGLPQKCADGLSQWNASHPVDVFDSAKGTYCNDYLGGVSVDGVTIGGALGITSFVTIYQQMALRKNQSGEAMGLMVDTLLHSPMLKFTADSILQNQFLAAPTIGNLTGQVGQIENTLRGWAAPLCWGDLGANPNRFYELVTKQPVKPFLVINRQSAEYQTLTSPTDPNVFNQKTFMFGVDSRFAPGWGPTFLSSRSGPSE